MYRIKSEISGQPAEVRRLAREARIRPLLVALERYLREKLAIISQKSTLADAIRYATSRWVGLTLFVVDGRVEMDSNTVERSIRPLTLNRKNALFAGSDRGGEHWAVIASLVETCKLNGVDPQACLADAITRIVDGIPQSCLDELMPWAYPTIPGLKAAASTTAKASLQRLGTSLTIGFSTQILSMLSALGYTRHLTMNFSG